MDAATEALCEALDNVTASLETVLLHFGDRMTPSDFASRTRRCEEARGALAAHGDASYNSQWNDS